MENQVKTSTENKSSSSKSYQNDDDPFASADCGTDYYLSYVQCLTNFRMMNNLPLVLSQVYVTMISATGVFFI